jgi:hypothetical protein
MVKKGNNDPSGITKTLKFLKKLLKESGTVNVGSSDEGFHAPPCFEAIVEVEGDMFKDSEDNDGTLGDNSFKVGVVIANCRFKFEMCSEKLWNVTRLQYGV